MNRINNLTISYSESWWNWDSSPGNLAPESELLILMLCCLIMLIYWDKEMYKIMNFIAFFASHSGP